MLLLNLLYRSFSVKAWPKSKRESGILSLSHVNEIKWLDIAIHHPLTPSAHSVMKIRKNWKRAFFFMSTAIIELFGLEGALTGPAPLGWTNWGTHTGCS